MEITARDFLTKYLLKEDETYNIRFHGCLFKKIFSLLEKHEQFLLYDTFYKLYVYYYEYCEGALFLEVEYENLFNILNILIPAENLESFLLECRAEENPSFSSDIVENIKKKYESV